MGPLQVLNSLQELNLWATPECRNAPWDKIDNRKHKWLTWRGLVDDRHLVVDLSLAAALGPQRTLEFLRPRYYVSNKESLINDTTF